MQTATKDKPITIQTFGRVSVAHLNATQQQSIEFAKARGGRLLHKGELIAELNRNPELERSLQTIGSYFFLIEQKGTKLSDHQRIDNANNAYVSISENEWKKLPFAERGFAWKGKGPLFAVVYNQEYLDIRVYLFADTLPTFTAPLIVYTARAATESALLRADADIPTEFVEENAPADAKASISNPRSPLRKVITRINGFLGIRGD